MIKNGLITEVKGKKIYFKFDDGKECYFEDFIEIAGKDWVGKYLQVTNDESNISVKITDDKVS